MTRRDWTRSELLQALRLYMRLPFGRLHDRNPEIIALAERIGRTPGSVGMKACNFASLDAAITSTGRRGLSGASAADRTIWAEFMANPEEVAAEAEALADQLPISPNERQGSTPPPPASLDPQSSIFDPHFPDASTETELPRLTRARRVQSFFRAAVLTSYESRCAISGLSDPRLLNASHIIPWSTSIPRRADPTNGLCLNALFDRAFDRGLITFDESLRVVVSPQLQTTARNSPPRLLTPGSAWPSPRDSRTLRPGRRRDGIPPDKRLSHRLISLC